MHDITAAHVDVTLAQDRTRGVEPALPDTIPHLHALGRAAAAAISLVGVGLVTGLGPAGRPASPASGSACR